MEPWEFLQSLPLFQDLAEPLARRLAAEVSTCRFETGETIFYQQDPGDTCHIIQTGKVRVFVMGEDGRELSVNILGPGEIIGEMAIFESLPRSASVEALEPTLTLELHRDTLIRSLQASPELALELLRALSARLRYVTLEAEGLASLTVAERVMRRLGQLAQWMGKPTPDGVKIMLPMTQQELATLIGTSRESVNRALVGLRRQGKIRQEEGWFILLKPTASEGTPLPAPDPVPPDDDEPVAS